MGEMAQAETEVYATRSVQVWKTLLNWLAFFFHIFLQIVRGTPSLAQVFSYIGLGHQSLLPSDSPSFKPLPVVELPESPESAAALQITAGALAVPDESDHLPIQRLTVVLDLDETLVCAYETSSLPAIVHHQATEAGLKWFELDCISSEKDREGKPKVNHVTVFERPGLGEFLKQLSEFADLVLFTAGLEGYARPLVDRIDFDNRFSHRLYRPSTISTGGMGMCFSIPVTETACVAVSLIGMKPGTPFLRDACTDAGLPLFCILKKDNLDTGHYQLVFQMKWNMESFVLDFFRNNTYREYREHVKDLSCLSKNLCRTVIVDNNPFSFLLQPMNGIPCVPFSAGQPQDDQLLEVILPLLRHLAQQKDVRPILYEKFHMPEWFQKHGIPSSSWTK